MVKSLVIWVILDSQNKMALPLMYRRRWRHIHAFIGKNTIALRVQRFAAGANIICLTLRHRLMSCHWSCDPQWVKISGHSEQLGPCGSTSHFVNNRHSKVKTRGASCIGGFGQTDGLRKFQLGIPQSRGAFYIRGASYIRDKTVVTFMRKSKIRGETFNCCSHLWADNRNWRYCPLWWR